MVSRLIAYRLIAYKLHTLHESGGDVIFPRLEVACKDMLAGFANEPKVERQVVDTEYLQAKHLLRMDEVTHIGAGIVVVHKTGAAGVQFGEVILPLLVAQVHHAILRKDHTIATITGWHDAVEHIHAAFDTLQDIPWCTYTHEVARFVLRQNIVDHLNHGVHIFGRFAYSQSANSITIAVKITQAFCGILTQVGIYATLYDREEVLLVALEVGGIIKALDTTVEPAMGALHGLLCVLAVGGTRATLVKCHDDVGTNLALDIHDVLGGKHQFTSIYMRRELHALFGHFADIGQGEDLEATRVGENRACPALKTVQATRFVQDLGARTQIEMVGIAKDDLCVDILFEEGALHTFDSTHGTHGHKNRGLDIPMVGMHHASACARVRIRMYKVKKNFLHLIEMRLEVKG